MADQDPAEHTATLSAAGEITPAGPAPRPEELPAAEELPFRERGRYELLEEHARGGLGRIWRARDRELDRVVALKEVLPRDGTARARFVREALVTARLEHPAIVPVHEAGRWSTGEPFYVMKLVSGRTLAEVVRDTPALADRLALLPGLLAVTDAIAYAHAHGVAHRDLKPANVIVGDYGETVVIDWGLAKDLRAGEPEDGGPHIGAVAADATVAGSVVGTPAFMPPEQARGEPLDERADVYALGALLYYLLSGRAPYAGDGGRDVLAKVRAAPPAPIGKLEPAAPADLRAIVEKAMARAPDARYPSARELGQELRRFQAGQRVAAHRYSVAEHVERWVRRHLGVTIASALFVLALGIGASAAVIREQGLRRASDLKTLALLEQQGRVELAAGHPFRAAPYLVDAYRRNPGSLALRALVSQAVAPLARRERVLTAHAGDVSFVAYSAGGSRFVTAARDGTAVVWSSADGGRVATLHSAGDKPLEAAALSPDGKLVALTTGEAVSLYPADGGAVLGSVADEAYRVWFTPDGKRLIAGGHKGELRLRDVASLALVSSLKHHFDRIEDLAFTPDGKRFAVACWDQGSSIWDLETFQPLHDISDHERPVTGVAYSADGAWLVDAEADDVVSVRLADSGKESSSVRLPEGARFAQVAVLPDGQTVVTASRDGMVRMWHIPSGALLEAFDAMPTGMNRGAVRRDGAQMVTVGTGGSVQVWRLGASPWHVLERAVHDLDYAESEYSQDGKVVFGGTQDGTVLAWDAATGKRSGSFKVPGNGFAVAANRDGSRVVVIGTTPANLPPGLWEPATGRLVASLAGPTQRVMNVAVSADGAAFALASRDGSLRIYDSAGGASQAAFALGLGPLSAVAFRPDGRELAVGDDAGRLSLVERATGRVKRTAPAHDAGLNDVEYSHDGARLVTAGRHDQVARIWDAAGGKLLLTLHGQDDVLMRAAFSPDGTMAVTAGMDHKARLFDAASGELLRTIPGPSYTASFGPSGHELFTMGNFGYAVIWDIGLDRRGPAELAAFVARSSPWELVDGRLRPAYSPSSPPSASSSPSGAPAPR